MQPWFVNTNRRPRINTGLLQEPGMNTTCQARELLLFSGKTACTAKLEVCRQYKGQRRCRCITSGSCVLGDRIRSRLQVKTAFTGSSLLLRTGHGEADPVDHTENEPHSTHKQGDGSLLQCKMWYPMKSEEVQVFPFRTHVECGLRSADSEIVAAAR